MMNINVKYGIDTLEKLVEEGTTIGDIVSDGNLRCALGYGDNIRALINGVEQPNHAVVPAGATVKIETRANSKAVEIKDIEDVINALNGVIDNAAALVDRLEML